MVLLLQKEFFILLLMCARVTQQYSEIGWRSDPSWRSERLPGVGNCVIISRSSQSIDHGHVHHEEHVVDGHTHGFDDGHGHSFHGDHPNDGHTRDDEHGHIFHDDDHTSDGHTHGDDNHNHGNDHDHNDGMFDDHSHDDEIYDDHHHHEDDDDHSHGDDHDHNDGKYDNHRHDDDIQDDHHHHDDAVDDDHHHHESDDDHSHGDDHDHNDEIYDDHNHDDDIADDHHHHNDDDDHSHGDDHDHNDGRADDHSHDDNIADDHHHHNDTVDDDHHHHKNGDDHSHGDDHDHNDGNYDGHSHDDDIMDDHHHHADDDDHSHGDDHDHDDGKYDDHSHTDDIKDDHHHHNDGIDDDHHHHDDDDDHSHGDDHSHDDNIGDGHRHDDGIDDDHHHHDDTDLHSHSDDIRDDHSHDDSIDDDHHHHGDDGHSHDEDDHSDNDEHGDHDEVDLALFPGMQKISISHYPVLVCDGGRYDDMNFSAVPSSIGDIIIRWDKTPTFTVKQLSKFKHVTSLHLLGEGSLSFINNNLDSDSTNTNGFVTSLRMPEGSITAVPTSFLRKFTVLKELSLERNYLSRIENDAFAGIYSLEALFLSHNRLTRLNMGWLMSTTRLKVLDLRGTTINQVPMELSRIENALEYVDMSDNAISYIDASSFSACPNLRMVMISNNRITKMDTNAFLGTSKLQYLDLAANQLETIDDNSFKHFGEDAFTVNLWQNEMICDCNMAWLPEWILKRNSVGVYPDIKMQCAAPGVNKDKVFHGMTAYDFTCDRSDEITSDDKMPSDTSSSNSKTYRQLKTEFNDACPEKCNCNYDKQDNGPDEYPVVDCSGSGYTYIPSGISPLTKSFVFQENNLKTLDLGDLSALKGLRYMNFAGNYISDIVCTASSSDCIFDRMSYFNINGNELTYISADMIKYFPALHNFRFGSNQITSIPKNLLRGKSYLRNIELGPNPIVNGIDETLFNGLSIDIVRLSGLKLKKVPNFIRNQRQLLKLDLSDNQITTISPNSFDGLNKLQKLWLQNNGLIDIPDGVLRQMPNLVGLYLSENNLTTVREEMLDGVSERLTIMELYQNPFRCDCNMAWFKDYVVQQKMDEPFTDIRFMCSEPARVHGLRSDEMTISDFVCLDEDVDWKACGLSDKIYTNTDMATAIIVTIVVILVIVGLVLAYVFYCRKRPATVPHFNNTVNFNSTSNPNSAFVNLEEENKI
ncbi:uncharacterized protein LOC120329342 [Styela clava]